MEQPKNKFLEALEKGLGNHQDKQNILLECEVHIEEILIESYDCKDENEMMERIISRLGSPEEIAAMWKEELSVTPWQSYNLKRVQANEELRKLHLE